MATLVKSKTQSQSTAPVTTTTVIASDLSSSIPAPFPREQLSQLSAPVNEHHDLQQPGPSHALQVSEEKGSTTTELIPSIAYVERSCLATLNTLLSGSHPWSPIVPDRRHSLPSSPQSSSTPNVNTGSALQTLVSNLRSQDLEEMQEQKQGTHDSELIQELCTRVDRLAPSLDPEDAQLAQTLVSLLSHLNRLSVLQNTPPKLWQSNSWALIEPSDPFVALKRQVSDFQIERLTSQQGTAPSGSTPMVAVETALLWSRIDDELETVASICKERTDTMSRYSVDGVPPQYDYDEPPEYDAGTLKASFDDSKSTRRMSMSTSSEKMRLDFEAVTMAIDRLYLVAPQLHNQRVELKSSKVEQMQRAAMRGKGKEKQKDVRELENIMELIGKASDRTMKNQTVVLEGGMKTRLEKAKQRDNAKREAFVEQLAEHSSSRRLHGQDAVLQPPRTKDPDALLSLPEFIREAVPTESIRQDPTAMLTLPEFVRETQPPPMTKPSVPAPPTASWSKIRSSKKKSRDRSMSAPPLAWLRSHSRSRSRSSTPEEFASTTPRASESTPRLAFEVHYVAEHHENLQHILVFFSVTGATPGVDLEAEVTPGTLVDGGDHLIIKSGPHTSLPLNLPARATPGKKEITVQSGHFEVKINTFPSASSSSDDPIPLLDAAQLTSCRPTTYICASCSLPLIQSARIHRYRDLPSDHWEELVDAWMCHTDQKLNDEVAKHGKGFWPEPGQALVGGSYILFEASSVTQNNICPANEARRGEDWRLVRCLCGAVVGRCQNHRDAANSLVVYRFLKYAIRPVSPTAEPCKIPLSAFIVEDMAEFVRAHASYRFVVHDEEDERPRILLWLFKPNLQLSYTKHTQYSIPKSASINASKVLYKLLGPSEATTDINTILDRHPGFPQAEYLYYPMNICRRLAGLLKESNRSYPESMQVMTGLEVGWLRRG